ncbi:MAG TPA: asparagine synthase (glutamine-hydrolyzing) [Gemmataceae bacterium]|jgi:asparagine synthase (glutamine-hydrolysing)
MCGLAGFVGGFVPGLMARMNEAQKHRGPNGRGVFEDAAQGAALGHVRLAILDLTDLAAQPMYSPDGRYVLVFNGEIYNFRDLRDDLVKKGQTFSSSGDTEVLLHGLQRDGEEFLERLNGIFTLALWDRRERTLLAARDHLGIKPFYYTELENGALLFASELKALCAHPSVRREPDFEVLLQHLAYCHASGDRTAVKGIRRLPPGSLLRWHASTRSHVIHDYWRPSFDGSSNGDREQAAQQLRESLRSATVRQMVSDVPVGVLLSGGLDSSLLTAFARPQATADFRCFTISYPPEENALDGADLDAPHARRFTRELGLPLEEIEIKPRVAALWPELVYHLDEPIADPAAISAYLISRLAKERGTTVLLSGQGADEMFCGYPRYVAMQAGAWLKGVPRVVRRAIAAGAHWLPGSREGAVGVRLRRIRRLASVLHEGPDERFLAYCASTAEAEITRILSAEFRTSLGGKRFRDACLEQMNEGGLSDLSRMQQRDLTVYLPNHNLLYTDKMSMAVGLEARVPFLDVELLNTVLRYPPRWKLAGASTKVLLREAARGVVPDDIIDRRKAGFGAPYRKWLRYDLAEMWEDLLSDEAVKKRGWFDAVALRDARQRSQEGKVDLYMLQWAVLTMELWARRFLDGNPIAA